MVLQKKGYVSKTDSAQYALTAEGVDYVEMERARIPTLHRLLTSRSESTTEVPAHDRPSAYPLVLESISAVAESAENPPTITKLAKMGSIPGRREKRKERRVGALDTRVIKVERRGHVKDRRSDSTKRRKPN